MNKYELVVLVKAQASQSEKDSTLKQAADLITKGGGKIINSQVWLEKQTLTFSIKKCFEATFYVIKFESLSEAIEKIKQALLINEEILRFLVTRVE